MSTETKRAHQYCNFVQVYRGAREMSLLAERKMLRVVSEVRNTDTFHKEVHKLLNERGLLRIAKENRLEP